MTETYLMRIRSKQDLVVVAVDPRSKNSECNIHKLQGVCQLTPVITGGTLSPNLSPAGCISLELRLVWMLGCLQLPIRAARELPGKVSLQEMHKKEEELVHRTK